MWFYPITQNLKVVIMNVTAYLYFSNIFSGTCEKPLVILYIKYYVNLQRAVNQSFVKNKLKGINFKFPPVKIHRTICNVT